MRTNYENCLAITLKWEGGDANNPDDPGGKTRWGVTQATYSAYRRAHHLADKSVFQMTRDEMLAIYKANFWDAVKGDTLAVGVDLATWDYGVNSGPARARKDLLSVVGGTDIQTIQKLCAKRMSFLHGLPIWKVFGKGWSNRVADVEARAVKMQTSATSPAGSVNPTLRAEAAKATRKAKSNANTSIASGSTAVGTSASDALTNNTDQLVSIAMLGVMALAIAVGLYFIWRSRHNNARAEAYARVATEE